MRVVQRLSTSVLLLNSMEVHKKPRLVVSERLNISVLLLNSKEVKRIPRYMGSVGAKHFMHWLNSIEEHRYQEMTKICDEFRAGMV